MIRALKQRDRNLECVGYGGPKMAAAGGDLHEDLTQLAVMFFLQAILNIHKFYALLKRADRYFAEHHPDAVVLIDYPGFNWWIARKAKRHGIPVFYYGAPQMWAWAGWRVKKMKRLVDHVLCKLPFEAEWYRERGCNAHYVGHPYFDELQNQQLDSAFLNEYAADPRPLVTILAGSRTQEVANNLESFLQAAARIQQQVPHVRFAVASFSDAHARTARDMIAAGDVDADVFVGRTAELIHLASCCLACSGSVSLELLFHTKPSVILYAVPRWGHLLTTTFLIKVKYITLVNLLACDDRFDGVAGYFDPHAEGADQVPMPEYLTYEDKTEQLASHIVHWLSSADSYQSRQAYLAELKQTLAHGGASQTAANYMLNTLGAPSVRQAA